MHCLATNRPGASVSCCRRSHINMGPSITNSWSCDPASWSKIQQSTQWQESCALKNMHQWSIKERNHRHRQHIHGRWNMVQGKHRHLPSQSILPLLTGHSDSTSQASWSERIRHRTDTPSAAKSQQNSASHWNKTHQWIHPKLSIEEWSKPPGNDTLN